MAFPPDMACSPGIENTEINAGDDNQECTTKIILLDTNSATCSPSNIFPDKIRGAGGGAAPSSELQYLAFLRDIVDNGHSRPTRNASTRSVFARQLSFDLADGFPLLTTKAMFWRGIVEELKFFLLGHTDAKIMDKAGVRIWNGNTSREFLDSVGLVNYDVGDMGPLYGFQWRHFGAKYRGCNADYTGQGVDQLDHVITTLTNDLYSRRAFMTTFHADQYTQSPLPPCHGITVQFGVDGDNRLNCHMYQRSCDAFLGCPFNIASYALFTHIMCALVNNRRDELQKWKPNETRLVPGILTMSFGDCHIYETHLDAVQTQLARTPYAFPQLKLSGVLTLDNLHTLEGHAAPQGPLGPQVELRSPSHPLLSTTEGITKSSPPVDSRSESMEGLGPQVACPLYMITPDDTAIHKRNRFARPLFSNFVQICIKNTANIPVQIQVLEYVKQFPIAACVLCAPNEYISITIHKWDICQIKLSNTNGIVYSNIILEKVSNIKRFDIQPKHLHDRPSSVTLSLHNYKKHPTIKADMVA
jgi:thymidylate synthase